MCERVALESPPEVPSMPRKWTSERRGRENVPSGAGPEEDDEQGSRRYSVKPLIRLFRNTCCCRCVHWVTNGRSAVGATAWSFRFCVSGPYWRLCKGALTVRAEPHRAGTTLLGVAAFTRRKFEETVLGLRLSVSLSATSRILQYNARVMNYSIYRCCRDVRIPA